MRYVLLVICLLAVTATTALAAPQVTLTVVAYVDMNSNGMQDSGEPPKAGIDWVATNDRAVYHCFTDATGACGWVLPPGRWYVSAYQGFTMIYDVDVQLTGDLTVSAAIEPETVYIPLVLK